MKFSEKCFVILSKCLGADIFKKYWPVKGSYWNKNHIDKNNIEDLKSIIDQSFDFTRQHVQQLFLETVIFLVGSLSGYVTIKQSIGAIPILFLMHGYPFMIQYYNRILAKNKIELLKKNDVNLTKKKEEYSFDFFNIYTSNLCSEEINENHLLKIYVVDKYYVIKFGLKNVSPFFNDLEITKKYRQYIYENWTNDILTIQENIFLKNEKNIFLLWKNKDNK